VAKKMDEAPQANKPAEKDSATKKDEPKVIHVISPAQTDERQSKRLKLNDSTVCPVYVHDDKPLVISLMIEQFIIKRILVDTGSSANILYMDAFKKMSISMDRVNPVHVPLMGFSGSVIYAAGTILLPLQWEEGQSVMTEFI
ncbi:hypothetical protein, partial [Klebsiella pneumoniae]|uniref:hypothetical protein n=1 Tax=Klebsiella pneumoniae TaxID=573 RepID=UPI00193A7F32